MPDQETRETTGSISRSPRPHWAPLGHRGLLLYEKPTRLADQEKGTYPNKKYASEGFEGGHRTIQNILNTSGIHTKKNTLAIQFSKNT